MSLDVANQVMESYTQIDQAIDAFQTATGLHCPSGCGWCCENPNVEATPLEMLPLALELFRQGNVDLWLEKVKAINYSGSCVFYKPDPAIPGNGRCQVYLWRPSICRLFGFATVTTKQGQPELAVCVRHKAAMPDIAAAAQEAIAQGLPAPNFAEVAQQIANLNPYLGTERLPINQALRVAIERVGLYLQMGE
jgi:Fe-S-cluster containining protein